MKSIPALLLLTAAAVPYLHSAQPLRISQPTAEGHHQVWTVHAEKPGQVSAGIYNTAGTLVRSLAFAEPVEKGTERRLEWDLTDDLGRPVPPGRYQAKALWIEKPPRADYWMKIGISGNPPYVTSDGLGGWGANLGPPTGIAAAGDTLFASFLCAESSLCTGLQLMDTQGDILRRFPSFFPWDTRHAVALTGGNAWLALSSGDRKLYVARFDLHRSGGKILRQIPAKGFAEPTGKWKGRWTVEVGGLAASANRVYLTLPRENRLFVLDADSGRLLREVTLQEPRGIACGPKGIFLVRNNQVIEVDADGTPLRTVIDSGLDKARGLAVDASGRFFVSCQGQAQQVQVFSTEGALLRSIGRSGGRPRSGAFDKNAMLDPTALTVDAQGQLWVVENNEDFQRISVWDAETGTLRRDFFNMRLTHEEGKLSPNQDLLLVGRDAFHEAPGLSSYSVDLPARTWRPAWHLPMDQADMAQHEVLEGNTHLYDQNRKAHNGRMPYLDFTQGMLRGPGGRTYLHGGDVSLYRFDETTLNATPAALVYPHRVHVKADGSFRGDYDQGPNQWLTWADRNGDGRMAVDECIVRREIPALENAQRMRVHHLCEDDLALVFIAADGVIRRLRPREILPNGVPVYDWLEVEVVLDVSAALDFAGGDGRKEAQYPEISQLRPVQDHWLLFAKPESATPLNLPGIDGQGWWAGRNWRHSPLLFRSRDGTPRWIKLGRRTAGIARSGEMYHPVQAAGLIQDVLFVPDTLGQHWLWTVDGLYLGHLFDDAGMKERRDSHNIRVELTGAHAYELNGEVYLFTGDHGIFVHRICLPNRELSSGAFVDLSAEAVAQAQPWDPDGPVPGVRPSYTSILETNQPVKVDGHLDGSEWGGSERAPILLDDQFAGWMAVRHDAEFLYLALWVRGKATLANSGSELPHAAFASGGYVDVCLGPDWRRPQRSETLPGDLRILMLAPGNEREAVYVGYRPHAVNGQAVTLRSPAATAHFDHVGNVPGFQFVLRENGDEWEGEAAIPLEQLSLSGESVGFDVSIGVANADGTERWRAAHWAGHSEAAVVDRPGSSLLLPETWGTLHLRTR